MAASKRAKPKKQPKCAHHRARMLVHLSSAILDTIVGDRALLWCPACGAIGRVLYRRDEVVAWQLPDPAA